MLLDIPISSDNGEGIITLVSYEDNQFNWIENELTQGDVKNVRNGQNSVLTVFQNTVSWDIGEKITIIGTSDSKTMTVEGVISTIHEDKTKDSIGYLVCSEQAFLSLVGDSGYSVIDVQLESNATDNTVLEIRSLLPTGALVSDKRLSNSEAQDSYYTGAIFIYGFLLIIALITVFNIFNSMNASVSARTKQYGIMRSIGMSTRQLYKMIAAEAFTYVVLGCIGGCVLGLPFNRAIFGWLITDTWGTAWQIPTIPLLVIVLLCVVSALIAIIRPVKQIQNMTIVDTIKAQ